MEETTPFAFRPEEYEHYTPLEKQIAVLKSLGIHIPAETVNEYIEQMEEWPSSRTWIEGYPYTALLSEIGYPQWDEETWEISAFSSQAYWFDWEGYEISSDYVDILNGIHALSGGDFAITEVAVDDSQVDWENWTGTMSVRFHLNEKPCEYQAKVEGDWLDEGFLSYIGQLLKAERTSGQLYAMGDDSQGCILFYREAAWAEEFMQKTGLPLEAQ